MASTNFPYHASGNATERCDVHVPLSYYNPLMPYTYPQYAIWNIQFQTVLSQGNVQNFNIVYIQCVFIYTGRLPRPNLSSFYSNKVYAYYIVNTKYTFIFAF